MSDKFKFTSKERDELNQEIKDLFWFDPEKMLDRIEQIIQDRGNSIQDGWIDVEERLPEKEKQVSIQVTGNAACVGYIHEYGHWIIQSLTSSYAENGLHKVTKWQPLPSAPKQPKK